MDSVRFHPFSGENNPRFPSLDLLQIPLASPDPSIPVHNLSILRQRVDSLREFLSKSLQSHASIESEQIDLVSKQISSAIQQIILNGAALVASSQNQVLGSQIEDPTVLIARKSANSVTGEKSKPLDARNPENHNLLEELRLPSAEDGNRAGLGFPFHTDTGTSRILENPASAGAGDGNFVDLKLSYPGKPKLPDNLGIPGARDGNPLSLNLPFCSDSGKLEIHEDLGIPGASGDGNLTIPEHMKLDARSVPSKRLKNPSNGYWKDDDEIDADAEIIELDSVELLAEHIHFCEICGKGFKRDANLRMHMRAHGNQFKTLEALSKPDRSDLNPSRKIRFSCPFPSCNRNKAHKRFRPLKSAICVKNHFKRSHCPKMYSCNRCNKKSFSVVSDLKSHLKHCGECRWRCSCGTSFSRKDKLFGHVALFEGHMPVIVGEEKSNGAVLGEELEVDEEEHVDIVPAEPLDEGFFEGLLEGFGSINGGSFEDVLGFL